MFHYAGWFVVFSCIAEFFEFGGMATGSAEIGRILALLFLVMVLVSLVAMLVVNRDNRPDRLRSRHNHF